MTAPRRRCATWVSAGVWLVLGLVWGLDRLAPLRLPAHDAAFLGFLIPIATAVLHIFNAVGRITLAALHAAFLAFRTAMIGTARALRSGLWGLARGTGQLLDGLRRFYVSALRPFFSAIWRKLVAFEQYLKTSFQPLFDRLKWLKEQVNLIYRRFVRPILDVIDIIRQANRVLRVFHINVLQKLDTVLSEIERRIEEPFQWIYRRLTDVENWLNRIVTLDGFFQRLTFLRTAWRDLRHTTNMWWHQVHHEMTPQERSRYLLGLPQRQVPEVAEEFRVFVTSGAGADAGRIREAAADFELMVRHVRL